MSEIVPTILTTDITAFSQKIESLKGVAPRVQIDVVDGKFFPIQTLDLATIRDVIDFGDLKIDLHLMVEEPIGWINRCLEIVPDRIIGQVEKMVDPFAFINEVIDSRTQVGLAIDLQTPLNSFSEDLYLMADLILLLGVKAGQGGQEFNPTVIEKIKVMKGVLGDVAKIGVDGGLNEKNIPLCQQAGANIFCVGESFWRTEDVLKRYNELVELLS